MCARPEIVCILLYGLLSSSSGVESDRNDNDRFFPLSLFYFISRQFDAKDEKVIAKQDITTTARGATPYSTINVAGNILLGVFCRLPFSTFVFTNYCLAGKKTQISFYDIPSSNDYYVSLIVDVRWLSVGHLDSCVTSINKR